MHLGPFELHAPIGRGGTGVVWEGSHRARRVRVAVKVKVLTAAAARGDGVATAIAHEARLAASLDHDNIVSVLEHGVVPEDTARASEGRLPTGAPYLVMEFAGTRSLTDLCGRVPWERGSSILMSLLDALGHAHARGVVHLDIKPGNVLWSEDGVPRLTDFGLAHAVDRDTTHEGDRVHAGTPAYMAPEQFDEDERRIGPWTDLYGLGCVAWSLMTGAPPFGRVGPAAGLVAHTQRALPPLEPPVPVPSGLEDWLQALLEKDPRRRFARAADAAWALRDLGRYVAPRRAAASAAPIPDAPPTVPIQVVRSGARGITADLPTMPDLSPPVGARPAPRRAKPPFPEMPTGERTRRRGLPGVGQSLFGARNPPLIGRDAERRALWSALGEVHRTKTARCVVLRGPDGYGKSTLAAWLCESAHAAGAASILVARHEETPGATCGIVPMFRRGLRARAAPVDLRAALTELVGEAESRPLAAWLSPAAANEAPPLQRRTERAFRLLRALAAEDRPLVIWIDDGMWGEEALALAQHAMRAAAPVPALFLVTVSDDAAPQPAQEAHLDRLIADPRTTRVAVGPLTHDAHVRLIHELLGLDATLVRLVAERTAGNPLFAVQLVGHWVQRGLLEPGPDGYRLRPGATPDLPDDLHAVWTARVERALARSPSEDRRAVQLAAVLGAEVNEVEWRVACAEAGVTPSHGLVDALVATGLAHAGSPGNWSFVRPLLREAVLRLADEEGAGSELHGACARTLTMLGRDPGRRAAHVAASGDLPTALPLWRDAIDRSRRSGDLSTAAAMSARRHIAIAATPVAPSAEWGRALVQDATLSIELGRVDRAQELARQALAAAEAHGWDAVRIGARLAMARVLRHRGELAAADAELDACRDAATSPDPHLGAQFVLWRALVAHSRNRNVEAESFAFDAFGRFEALGAAEDCALAGSLMLSIARDREDYATAREWASRCLDIRERAGLRTVDPLVNLGDVERLTGHPVEAERRYREALELALEIETIMAAFCRANLGLALQEQGRWAEALAEFELAQAAFSDQQRATYFAIARLCPLPSYVAIGATERFDEALATSGRALDDANIGELDVARAATAAAELLDAAEDPTRAARARGLAEAHRARLGHTRG